MARTVSRQARSMVNRGYYNSAREIPIAREKPSSTRARGRRGARARARGERVREAQRQNGRTLTEQERRDQEIETTTGYRRDRYGKYRPPKEEARAKQEANRKANIARRARLNESSQQPTGGKPSNSP